MIPVRLGSSGGDGCIVDVRDAPADLHLHAWAAGGCAAVLPQPHLFLFALHSRLQALAREGQTSAEVDPQRP